MRNPSIKTYSSCAVAGYLLELAAKEGEGIDKQQLIKLVYLCHGWILGCYEIPLIHDAVKAWKYGPIIEKLYTKLVKVPPHLPSIPDDYFKADYKNEKLDKDKDTKEVIKMIWQNYKKYTGIELSMMTHRKGSPWSLLHRDGTENVVISDAVILKYYKELGHHNDVQKSKEKT